MTIKEVDERIDMKLGIYTEHMDEKFKQLLEAIDAMIERRVRPIVQEELTDVKKDMHTVTLAVSETNHDIRSLNQRMARLEKIIA